jgi:phage tail sheath protein FI
MAERLHPGVYVEERARGLAPIQGVSTSNYGTAGFTLKGPTNVATLFTSFEQFERTHGSFTEKGQVPTHLFAFFANGGRRAFVVRVVASDAVAADGFITSDESEEVIGAGDGTNKDFTSGGVGPLTLAHTPIEPSSVSITYKEAATPVAAGPLTFDVAPDGAAGVGAVIQNVFAITAGDTAIVPGTVTLNTLVSAAPVLYVDTAKDGVLLDGAGDARGFVDYKTGRVTISYELTGSGGALDQVPDLASTPTLDYTPVGTEQTITDDGAGALTGATIDGGATIDYTTGAVEFTVSAGSAAPHDLNDILVAYTARPFNIDPISKGAWGNDVDVQVRGNEDSFTRATASYSLHDVLVLLDSVVEEIFTGVDLTDPAAVAYVIGKINAPGTGSDLIDLVEPSSEDLAPDSLDGKNRTNNGGAGNGTQVDMGSTATADPDGFPDIPVPFRSPALATPVQPGSVSITYTGTSGTARTVTDDGNGNLIGDVDGAAPAGSNAVDYTTGKWAFRAVEAVSVAETTNGAGASVATVPGSLVSVSHYLTPADTTTTNALTGGSDGVAAIGRSQLTDPTLKTDREGMYALLTTDELLNIGIPDAAGNVTMALDQITEAETNGKWFIILATTAGLSPQGAKDYRRNDLGTSSSYGALYYPYITIADPVTDSALNIPPIGHIAGVYARTDTTKSVGKAPAGTVDGRLNFSIGLERDLEFAEIDVFFGSQVNALVDTAQTGRVVWGARSLENPPGDFRFVHVRRLFNFLKTSIFNSTHGFVFENVGAALRSRITLSVESFMRGLFNQGLFAGETPQEAFAVICDESNNPPEVEAAGEVICDIFVATNTPGEFVVFRIAQKFENT